MIELVVLVIVLAVVIYAATRMDRGLKNYSVRRKAGLFETEEDREAYEAAEAKVIGTKSQSAWSEEEENGI